MHLGGTQQHIPVFTYGLFLLLYTKLTAVPSLRCNQQSYTEPTILFARRITGEEEVPDGVVGLVGPDAPDVLAHLSVRARNMHVLFAACYEEEPLQQIEALVGKMVNMATTAGGTVTWAEGDEALLSPTAAENPLGNRKAIKVQVHEHGRR